MAAHTPRPPFVILVAGILMVLDADLSFGDAWISIGLGLWVVLMALGGAVIGPTSTKLMEAITAKGGYDDGELRATANRLLLFSRIETAILVLVIADMVAKPGG